MPSLIQIDTACALLEIGGYRLLTDPVFDPAGGHYHFGWGARSRKTSTPALTEDQVGPLDAVLVSHDQHDDNLDRAGRTFALRAPVLISTSACKLPNAQRLETWAKTALAKPGTPALSIQLTPAQHRPAWVPELISGKVNGFRLESPALRGPLWISGDTVMFPGIAKIAAQGAIDVAVLHVGGVRFPWLTGPGRYTFNAAEALETARMTKARKVIALHTSGWTHFKEGADVLRATFDAAGLGDRLIIPEPGKPVDLG